MGSTSHVVAHGRGDAILDGLVQFHDRDITGQAIPHRLHGLGYGGAMEPVNYGVRPRIRIVSHHHGHGNSVLGNGQLQQTHFRGRHFVGVVIVALHRVYGDQLNT